MVVAATGESDKTLIRVLRGKAVVFDLTHTPTRLIEVQARPRRIFALELNDVIFDEFNAMKE